MKKNAAWILKKILLTVGVFLGVVVLGALLIIIVYALPTDRVNLHVRESGAYLQPEGDYWRMLPNSPFTCLDNYTDSTMLLIAADKQPNVPLLQRAVTNNWITVNNSTKPESCMLLDDKDELGYAIHQYARYWHGYLVVLKPLLLFLNIDEIRQLNWLVIMGSTITIGILLHHRKKLKYLFPYLLSICFMNPGTIANSLQNSTIFHTASLAMILILLFSDRKRFRDHLWLFFMLVGMVTSYVDFLTYPILSLGFPLICWFILCTGSDTVWYRKAGKTFGHMALYSFMWGMGYAGMWSSKWVLASLVTGQHYVAEALQNIMIRSGNVAFGGEVTLQDLYIKLGYYLSISKIWTLTLVFVALCVPVLCLSKKLWSELPLSIAFLLIAVYPPVWGMATLNHTYIHDLFTHRNWGLTILGLSCSLLPLIGKPYSFLRRKVKEQS